MEDCVLGLNPSHESSLIVIFFAAFIIALQFTYGRLLGRILSRRMHMLLPWIMVILNLPMVIYMGFRIAGFGMLGGPAWLLYLARFGLFFQGMALVQLLTCGVVSIYWKMWRKPKPEELHTEGSNVDLERRAFLRKASLGTVGVLALAGGSGAMEAFGDPDINRLELHFPDLPKGFEGLRLVHLSDLHAGPMVGMPTLQKWRKLAERERPDLLIITGDFVDSLPQEVLAFEQAFAQFSAPMGRFAILGNHDYFTDPAPIWECLKRMDFHCLENEHRVLERGGAELVIFGLQDPMARDGRFRGIHFGKGPMPQDVALQMPKGLWRLCLCHRPSNWDLAQEAGARLTLSGHTHGGQINPIPGLSSARMLGPYIAGLYREGANLLYVNRGLGVVGLPMRVAAAPEITVITLRHSENPSLHSSENQIA